MRKNTPLLVLTVALMIIVMAVSTLIFFTGSVVKWTVDARWKASISNVELVKGINMAGDKADEIVVQSPTRVLILNQAGEKLFETTTRDSKVTMGDLNGDGLDDLVVFQQPSGEAPTATAYTGNGAQLWRRAISGLGQPMRANSVDLDGDGVREIVVGDDLGQVACLNSAGQVLWSFQLPNVSPAERYVRGLDDVSLGDGRHAVAAASYAGQVALLDGDGQPLWSAAFQQKLRRLRAYDLDGDGVAEVILGGEYGLVEALDSRSGRILWQETVGSRVTEMREAVMEDEVGQSVIVGTKAGKLFGFNADGDKIFQASLGTRVQEIVAVDLDADGKVEVIAGGESGRLALFDADGDRLTSTMLGSAITRVDGGKHLGEGAFMVSTQREVSLRQAQVEKAPFWYNPLTAGLLACVIIAAGAWGLSNLKSPPKLEYSAEEVTVEALQAKRKMLKESLAEVRQLQQSGEVPSDAYTARTRELRAHIARVEAELIRQGIEITPEVMKCPNCGGTIELGADRCEYCGQTVI